jgi:hypothetical protein
MIRATRVATLRRHPFTNMRSRRRFGRFATTVLIASAASAAIATGIWLAATPLSPKLGGAASDHVISYLLISNAVLLLMSIVLGVVYADARRYRGRSGTIAHDRTRRLLEHLDLISHRRTALSYYSLLHENEPSQGAVRAAKTAEFLEFLTDETRQMFDEYVKRPCAVAIKLIRPSADGRPEVQTYIRDSRSRYDRSQVDLVARSYPLEAHSPFLEIVRRDVGLDYYLCNDLRREMILGDYRNGHKDWPRYYNATLIVPIKDPDEAARQNLLGFLCIDTLLGEFDNAACLYMARIAANSVFLAIVALSILGTNGLSVDNDDKRPDESAAHA